MVHARQQANDGATANIDPREIAQFEALAGKWWDAEGPFRMLHRIGPPRLAYVRDAATEHLRLDATARRPYAALTCLDVGCGGGLIAEPLARLGGAVTAIDPAVKNIEAARHHAASSRLDIDYQAVTAEALADAGRTFDLVTCLEVVEHVPDPGAFVATLASLVKPGGLLVLSTLNRTPKSYALAIVGAEYVLGWLPRGTHDWTRFVTPDELQAHCTAAGLTAFASEGIVYDLLRDRWQRSPDTGVNYMACAVKGMN
ncbi:MAG: bifunctional 2-polyprenyl-6-hydroxyphenol methylase/3-demethylubiquinol 3-O-methyltransferase UbiG [Hyphomicrobiaceae bacterium]